VIAFTVSTTPHQSPADRLRSVAARIAATFICLAAINVASAVPPPAGTSITNQASATYTDSLGVSHTVTSNAVQTTVTQVGSLTLTANGAQNATAGTVVYYPHILTNTGNGSDTFNLTTGNAGGFTMSGVQIFADNGSGQPTGPAITASGALAGGATFKFIVAATLPATATAGQTNTVTVTATSTFDNTKTASNTDVTTVTNNAVVTITKAVSAASGAAGSGPYTYTLSYTNTGNSTATLVAVTDAIPTGMTYVAGSARWSVTGATALSDTGGTTGTVPNTITSTYTLGSNTWTATLAQVTAGQSGTLTFQVNVAAATTAGTLNNTATYTYNNGGGTTVSGNTNTVGFSVRQAASLAYTGVTVAGPAAPGTTVTFTNPLTNNGNSTDTFNITVGANNFPAGTTFQLFKSDGVTPLTDTNGDGIPDTGPVAAAGVYNVVVKATLPASATNTGAPFTVQSTATSVFNSAVSATATDTLSAISPNAVDLTNNSPFNAVTPAPGQNAGPEAAAVVTNATNPGTTTTFVLVANNRGPSPDSYVLGASTVSSFATQTLPGGWTVTFKADGGAGNCSTTGATITSTATVAALGNAVVCASVAVPAGYAAGTNDLYFRALSATAGVSDTIHDAVTVNAVRSITFTPNHTGQVSPGGSLVYTQTLTNTGNVTEGNGTLSSIAFTSNNNQAGWTSTLYYNADGASTLDSSDPQITGNLNTVAGLGAGLAAGQSITIFVKVVAPSGAAIGTIDTTTNTATTTNGTYASAVPAPAVAVDTTSVIADNLSLVKAQALDAACSGPTGGTVYATTVVSAKPGQCVDYQITVTNNGASNATTVVVSDSTPTFTTLNTLAATTVGSIAGGAPAVGGTGTINANVGTLTPGQAAIVTFGVKINP
jgi:trimeric autotransporter adhesin